MTAESTKILEGLGEALRAARRAARQYAEHAELFGAWGLPHLEAERRVGAGGERRLAALLERRIRQLRGDPERTSPPADAPPTMTQLLERDLRAERDNFRRFQQLTRLSRQADDAETLELVESSMLDAEVQIERLECQLDRIDEIGEEEFRRECAEELEYC